MRRRPTARTLAEVIDGADIFLGLSAAGVLKPRNAGAAWREQPLIMALANPIPEIMPDDARAVRPDAMICTGRSDFPNQVNNVLCFPYIFRGALDCGATTINEEMKLAAVRGHRRAGARRAVGRRRARLWRRGAGFGAGLAHSLALRSAPDPAHRAGRRQGRDGVRRGDAPDRRSSMPMPTA